MSNFISKATVKVGAKPKSKFNLSNHVVTTQDFGVITPILSRECVPGDSWHINAKSFCRLMPMETVAFADIYIKTYAFFVPYRLCMKGFEQFITNTKLVTNGGTIDPNVPNVTNKVIYEAFTNIQNGWAASVTSGADFGTSSAGYRFTQQGKRIYNLLVNLGYHINFTVNDTTKFSLLPILAYARVYSDWFYPSQYMPSDPIRPFFENPNLNITSNQSFAELMDYVGLFSYLDKDLFTSAWRTPNGPIDENTLSIQNELFGFDDNDDALRVTNIDNKGAKLIADGTGINAITQYGLNVLKATQNYLNRNMLAGNRYIEQLLARFGVRVPDSTIQRSEFLGSNSQPVNIQDVMCTADTTSSSGSELGSYAGKGISYGEHGFNYDCKEFGHLFVFSVIMPRTGYVQGRHAESGIFHLDRFDFYTPEYDNLGTSPIRNDQLFGCFTDNSKFTSAQMYGGKPNGIFGYAPSYYEYKCCNDVLSGDFIIKSLGSESYQSWHTFRLFDDPSAASPLVLGLKFLSIKGPGTDYDRIFQVTSTTYDHFYMSHVLDVTAERPMSSLGDSIITDNHHGREVELPYNGFNL